MSDDEVSGLIEELARPRGETAGDEGDEWNECSSQMDPQVNARLAASERAKLDVPLARLARRFHLTPFETQCVVIALAPELDRRYERVYGYLQTFRCGSMEAAARIRETLTEPDRKIRPT